MTRPLRVRVVTNIPSQHIVDQYDAVAALDGVDVEVIYLRAMTPGRLWTEVPRPKHRHVVLPVLFNDSRWFLNPTLTRHLAPPVDLLVIGQYAGISYQVAMAWATLTRTPFVFWSEAPGVQGFEVKGRLPDWVRPALRRVAFWPAAKAASAVWGVGRRAQEVYEDWTGRPCGNLPYYAAFGRFARGEAPYAPDGRVRFLFVGRYSHRKGFDTLCEAFERLEARGVTGWTLTTCGAGDLGDRLGPLARLVGDRLDDRGFLQLSKIPDVMRAHDVFVTPSRYDGWGMVVPEALSAGLPVLGSDAMGATYDIGPGKPGLEILPAGDPEVWADALERMVAAKDRLLELGAAAAALGRPYDASVGAERFLQLARAAVEGR